MIGMADENEFTQEQVDDGERDALAIAPCFVRGDLEAAGAISRNADAGLVITGLGYPRSSRSAAVWGV
jgi:hypothetical protein